MVLILLLSTPRPAPKFINIPALTVNETTVPTAQAVLPFP